MRRAVNPDPERPYPRPARKPLASLNLALYDDIQRHRQCGPDAVPDEPSTRARRTTQP
ncbi:hypothetical protein BLAT2472_50468 [Burkholderia latens]